MKYILMAFGLCFGACLYLAVGLILIAAAPIDIFEAVAESGYVDDYWMAMVLWPVYLVIGALQWCIDKIDKLMEE